MWNQALESIFPPQSRATLGQGRIKIYLEWLDIGPDHPSGFLPP
jgi:hypothetical protein